jgi:hypothetical protein
MKERMKKPEDVAEKQLSASHDSLDERTKKVVG